MKKLDPREFSLNDNASSPAESARVGGRFYVGIFSNKRIIVRILAALVVIFFAFLIFISFFPLRFPNKHQPQPTITLMPSSPAQQFAPVKDQLFYANQSGFFAYDITTHETRQIAATNASTSIFNGQRISSDTIGFQVRATYGNATSAVYVLNFASSTLTKEADIGGGSWLVDNLNFITPGEFVYSEMNMSSTMIDNYEHVFLFDNGTTTQIGYISNPGEYGSVMSVAPDGKRLFFANQIYDMITGRWSPIVGTCKGVQSAWLNNDVVVFKRLDDWNVGDTCYYDVASGKKGDVGGTEGFAVIGNNIVYETTATATPSLFQIWSYDYGTRTAHIVVPSGQLYPSYEFNMNDLAGAIYQPTISSGTCMDLGCWGGFASGSLMMLNLATGSSTPLMFNVTSSTYTTVF
jgi:hypothetical protein